MLYLKTDGVLTLKQRRCKVTVQLPIIYQQCVVNLFSNHLCNVDNVGYMHCPTSLLVHFQTQELSFWRHTVILFQSFFRKTITALR